MGVPWPRLKQNNLSIFLFLPSTFSLYPPHIHTCGAPYPRAPFTPSIARRAPPSSRALLKHCSAWLRALLSMAQALPSMARRRPKTICHTVSE